MSRIYELNQAQQELLDRLYWLNETDEEDAGEIDLIKKELLKIRGSAENTAEFLSGLLINFNYDASVHEDERKRLVELAVKANKRKHSAEKNAERIESIMFCILKRFDIDKVSSKHGNFAPTITPGVIKYSDNFDVDYIDERFVQMSPSYKEPVTKEIMAFLRSKIEDKKTQTIVVADELPGVSLIRREGIKIK